MKWNRKTSRTSSSCTPHLPLAMQTVWGCDLQPSSMTVVGWQPSQAELAQAVVNQVMVGQAEPLADSGLDLQALTELEHWQAGDGVVLVLPEAWVQQCELPVPQGATHAQTQQELWSLLQFQAGWNPETHVIDWWVDTESQPATARVYCTEQSRIQDCRQAVLRLQAIPLMATPASLARWWAQAPTEVPAALRGPEFEAQRRAWGAIQSWASQGVHA